MWSHPRWLHRVRAVDEFANVTTDVLAKDKAAPWMVSNYSSQIEHVVIVDRPVASSLHVDFELVQAHDF